MAVVYETTFINRRDPFQGPFIFRFRRRYSQTILRKRVKLFEGGATVGRYFRSGKNYRRVADRVIKTLRAVNIRARRKRRVARP